MTSRPETMPTQMLFRGIEAELKRCMDLLLRIEDEVLPIVTASTDPSLRAALQDIDLLSQCIDDIRRCVHATAMQDSTHAQVDAAAILSTIRLQDMRIRLEGGSYDSRLLQKRDLLFDPPQPPKADNHLLF